VAFVYSTREPRPAVILTVPFLPALQGDAVFPRNFKMRATPVSIRLILTVLIALPGLLPAATAAGETVPMPSRADTLKAMHAVNDYFMAKWPDPGRPIEHPNRTRPSNIWTRGVYYEGLMQLWAVDPSPRQLDYAIRWGEFHQWGLRGEARTRNADNQCAGQTYIDLYKLDPRPERIRDIRQSFDLMIESGRSNDWTWIDAAQMAMPALAKLGALLDEPKYFDYMHALYLDMKLRQGGSGLFNPEDGLWWRDRSFTPPYREPNGEDCYWARGNGWVVAALIRTLDALPANSPYREEYTNMLRVMCDALRKVQRSDGFWNVSLHDPGNFGGKEVTGTSLFTAGMAWGVRHGVLERAVYEPVIARAWSALLREGVRGDGFLRYVQGTGKEPKDSQPVGPDREPDFEDFGIGCFLLAGAEVYKLPEAGGGKAGFEIADIPWASKVGARAAPASEKAFNVTDFGAKADGATLNTAAIQAAIDTAHKAGGGVVTFAPGQYLTGSIYIKTGVHFVIPEGVTLLGSTRIEDYPRIDTRVAGIEMKWPSALINVLGQEKVKISGKGVVFAQGKVFWEKYRAMALDYRERGLRWIVDYDCERPRTVLVSESQDVSLQGVTFQQAGFWTVHVLYSSHCTIDGITIQNNIGGHGPSTDGVDIDSSSWILVENCDIDCNDDNYCLKAGRDADGLRVNRPAEYIVIRHCVSRAGSGLFTCGSETSGGIRHVLVHDMQARGTSTGFRLKSAMNRGGTTEDIYIKNIKMEQVGTAFSATMNWNPSYSYSTLPKEYEGRELPAHWVKMLEVVPPEKGLPHFRDIRLSNFEITSAKTAIDVAGDKNSLMENFAFDNINIKATRGGKVSRARNWAVDNVNIKTDAPLQVTESEGVRFPVQ
jgi:rhamnogalacturonyl hydrolase YesR